MKNIYKNIINSAIISLILFLGVSLVHAETVQTEMVSMDLVSSETSEEKDVAREGDAGEDVVVNPLATGGIVIDPDSDGDGLEDGTESSNGVDDDCDGTEDECLRDSKMIACTADAKMCSDGSAVGRVGPQCEFAACPGEDDGAEKMDFTLTPDRVEATMADTGDNNTIENVEEPKENRAGYIKFGDIKGESTDTADHDDDGHGDTGDTKELTSQDRLDTDDDGDSLGTDDEETAGAKSSKPKEIVVVGSKIREAIANGGEIRGWDPVKKEVILKVQDIKTEEDVADYAGALLASSEEIETISIEGSEVRMTSRQPVKLFGLFGVSMEQRVQIFGDPDFEDAGVEVKVKFPWWSFLAKKTISADDIENTFDEELRKQIEVADSSIGQDQQEVRQFQMMSNIMKTSHDTMMSIIGNMR